MDYEPASRWSALETFDRLLILKNRGFGLSLIVLIHVGDKLYVFGFSLNSLNQLSTVLLLNLPQLNPFKDCSIGVRTGKKTSCASDDGTQVFARLNTIATGMHHLAFDLDRGCQILPVRYLTNGKDIAVSQPDVGVRFSEHRL